ncbi:hypothetical protein SADUNF_Sadunf06G0023300 [Salix dunnii]|uniref:Uncharacterized protein n=1 Tax=Salix dunnii TaxID=1413687 RepID=A0A835MWJ8_9ROSI|nr:hypothetical protein SADUNF_Sadunf06G0023300 [Salix dunnii]
MKDALSQPVSSLEDNNSSGVIVGTYNWVLLPLVHKSGENIDLRVGDKTFLCLNRKDMQETLHAKLVGTRQWSFCSRFVDGRKVYGKITDFVYRISIWEASCLAEVMEKILMAMCLELCFILTIEIVPLKNR